MNNILYTFLLACFVFLGCCCRTRQVPEDLTREKEPAEMIQIQNLTLTEKTLTFNYRVSNPFEDSILVCYDIWVYGEQNVQDTTTRIEGDTVWIKLRFKRESPRAFEDPVAIGKYIRLSPGESCSGRILQDLPIKDHSLEDQAKHKEIVLHRVAFEIGYIGMLGPRWNAIRDSLAEEMRERSIESKLRILGPHYVIPVSPFITEETLDGQLREVMYLLQYTSFIKEEQSAKVLITDVAIPCSVVVDDK